jgi:GNAT superfamily N-acetyltransferase
MKIGKVKFEDADGLFALMQAMAIELNQEELLHTSTEKLREDGFSSSPYFEAYIIYGPQNQNAGFALYTYIYSGWKGRRRLYLEDLYILPEFRGKGFGKSLFEKICDIAHQEEIKLVWEVPRDNFILRHYYQNLGAIDRQHKVGFYLPEQNISDITTKKED